MKERDEDGETEAASEGDACDVADAVAGGDTDLCGDELGELAPEDDALGVALPLARLLADEVSCAVGRAEADAHAVSAALLLAEPLAAADADSNDAEGEGDSIAEADDDTLSAALLDSLAVG